MSSVEEKSEVERLVYEGNKVPAPIRLAWTLILLFSIYYVVAYSWPDLKHWLGLLADGGP